MSRIKKTKNNKQIIAVPSATSPKTRTKSTKAPSTRTKRPKKAPVAYYGCLSHYAQTGFPNQITACCQNCKQKAPTILAQRQSEIKKLITSYRQVGESLSKLLTH